MYIDTQYLDKVFTIALFTNTIKKLERKILKFKKDNKLKIDAIVFTGISGAAFAFPLSVSLKIPLLCIRKEKSHSNKKLEGAREFGNYIIVDDFIDTGATIKKIINTTKRAVPGSKPVGVFLYNQYIAPPGGAVCKVPVICV
jgi:adenine/guanine phosphoribosyltransferase-like PRPP-binding protein